MPPAAFAYRRVCLFAQQGGGTFFHAACVLVYIGTGGRVGIFVDSDPCVSAVLQGMGLCAVARATGREGPGLWAWVFHFLVRGMRSWHIEWRHSTARGKQMTGRVQGDLESSPGWVIMLICYAHIVPFLDRGRGTGSSARVSRHTPAPSLVRHAARALVEGQGGSEVAGRVLSPLAGSGFRTSSSRVASWYVYGWLRR